MRDLEQRLRNVEMGLRARPVKVPLGGGGAAPLFTLFATQGAHVFLTVGSIDITGVGTPATPPSHVPTATPPASGWPAGLGRARLNSASGPLVWISTRCRPGGGTNPIVQDLFTSLYNLQTWISRATARMPVGSDAGTEFVTVYLPFRI